MKEKRILIRSCHIVDPVSGRNDTADILIEEGVIQAVDRNLPVPSENEQASVIEAAGLTAVPGLMDTHVHFRDPGFTWKEDLITGSAAAVRGGVTSVVAMANTNPVVDNTGVYREITERARELPIKLYQASSVTRGLKGKELVNMEALAEAGVRIFTDDGIPIMDEALLLEALKRAKALDRPVSLHEEDPLFIKAPGVNAGRVSEILGYPGAFSTAEEILTARDCVLALHTGAKVCIQHISSGRSVDIVRTAKRMGADIHAEATPHHFTLTEEAVLKYGTNARMNPPLRTEEDRLAIIEGLRDGTIDMIVTDHAPHSSEEKAKPLQTAPSGIIGLETSLALGIRELVQPGYLSLMELITLMSSSTAIFAGVRPASVAAGEEADLVLFDLKKTWLVDHFASRASNSPFLGWELPGKIIKTICRGKVVYEALED